MTSIFRVIAAGFLGGILLFIIPFLLFKLLFFFLFAGLLFRIVGGGWRRRRWQHFRQHPGYFDAYQDVTPERERFHDTYHSAPKPV